MVFVHFWWYLAELLLEWEMFQKEIVGNVKTNNFLVRKTPPPQDCTVF